jgi:hypothetical protein
MIYKSLLAVAAFIFAVFLARWIEEGDYYHPPTQRHHCVAWPWQSKSGRIPIARDSRTIWPISIRGWDNIVAM